VNHYLSAMKALSALGPIQKGPISLLGLAVLSRLVRGPTS
jgi:hypothetical protein